MMRIPVTPALCALALAAVAPQAQSSTTPLPSSHVPIAGPVKLPDLVISSFGLSHWGVCAPGKTVMTFQVTVKNQGAGAMASTDVVVWVHDLKTSPAQDWGTGQSEYYSLAPGQSHTYSVNIQYYGLGSPSFMTTGAPHPFQAVVNPKHLVTESNYANNLSPGPAVWNGQKVIMVGAPKGCPK